MTLRSSDIPVTSSAGVSATHRWAARSPLLGRATPWLAGLCLLLPLPAAAAPRDPADALFHEGKREHQAGHQERALELYSRAWSRKRTHDIAGNLGQLELKLGRYRDAAEHLRYCVDHYPPTASPEARDRARELLLEAAVRVGAVRVTLAPLDATLLLDGRILGVARNLPPVLYLEPGRHRLELRSGEGSPSGAVEELEAKAGTELQLRLTVRGPAPVQPVPPPASPEPQRREWVLWVGLGATAAAGLTSLVITLERNSLDDRVRSLAGQIRQTQPQGCLGPSSPLCQQLQDKDDAWRSLGIAQAGALIATGGLAAATLATYILWPEEKRTARLSPVLWPHPAASTVGLQLSGSF